MTDNRHHSDQDFTSEAWDCEPSGSHQPSLMTLYVNIPFCRSKCTFCDYVHEIPTADLLLTADAPLRQNYIAALCAEIRQRGEELADKNSQPHVVYWGGGTASILEEDEICAIVSALRTSFNLDSVVESTIECSPDTVDLNKLKLFRSLGFNRLSSGVQSFHDERLRRVGRRHNAEQARQIVYWAREAGFTNVSIDLMCGFPDEEIDELYATISQAIALKVDHLSLYPFRPTPGTRLRKVVDDDREVLQLPRQKQAFHLGRTMMTKAGFNEYALGYFGMPSIFALLFFQLNSDVIGFGSGAVSYYDHRCRTHHKGKLREYIASPHHYDSDVSSAIDAVAISLLRAGLSYFPGISRERWQDATGSNLDEVLSRQFVAPIANYLRAHGLIEDQQGIRLPTESAANTLMNLNFQLFMQSNNPSLHMIRKRTPSKDHHA